MKLQSTQIAAIISLIVIVTVIVSPMVLGYKLSEPTTLYFSCTLNNQVPSPTTYYNITINYVDTGTVLVDNIQTTPLGQGMFAYNITFNNSGYYEVRQWCYDGSYNYSNVDTIFINGSGEELTISIVFTYVFSISFFIFLLISLIYYTNKLPNGDTYSDQNEIIQVSQLKHLRVVSYGLMYLIFVVMMFIVSNFMIAYLQNQMLGSLFFTVYKLLFYGLWIMTPLCFIWYLYKVYKSKEMKELIERGVPFGGKGL